MKTHSISLVLLSFQVKHVSSLSVFRPYRIPYEDLLKDDVEGFSKNAFTEALTEVGMVSVTGIFAFSGINHSSKEQMLASLHDCLIESDATQDHKYLDGTVRRTLATKTVSGAMQTFGAARNSGSSCRKFFDTTDEFRRKVSEATSYFSKHLSSVLELKYGNATKPLLVTNGEEAFSSFSDIVENGEHLEHFHSYQKPFESKGSIENTIEWHTDQGLFIAFTPARRVTEDHQATESLQEGFYIELTDGIQAQVQFDDSDDLVFMLGDGVNQYINTNIRNVPNLRATPHAVVIPDQKEGEARVWYGRMVLPPPDAIHPIHGITFRDIRDGMIRVLTENDGDNALSLGCSAQRRAHEEEDCTSDEMYCWHRCMNISAYNVSEQTCTAQGSQLNCVNPRGQITDGGHGDYFPGCVALDAVIATPYPSLPDFPRDNLTCTEDAWNQFNAEKGFDHEFELPNRFIPDGPGGMFMWSIVDDELHGRLSFNGIFGWLAFGFANPGGAKNGMHGSEIIMALPGGNYSAVTGLDLAMGSQIDDYMIALPDDQSSFRFWQTPIVSTTRSLSGGSAKVNSTDCFTALYFNLTSIADRQFNLTGEDDLIWGANGEDYFVGYHSGSARRFHVNWLEGNATLFMDPPQGQPDSAPTSNEAPAPIAAPTPVAAPTPSASASHVLIVPFFVMNTLIGLTICSLVF